jgi:D-sedoheptulose 7-phosphate isomerase
MNQLIENCIAEHITLAHGIGVMSGGLFQAAEAAVVSLRAGGRLLFCGNGGSAADAQHLAAEFTGRFLREREPWDAIALHANTSALSAVGNDYGFDQVFAREVRAHGRKGDVLICISTSGNSPNVLAALNAARKKGMTNIGLTGKDGGKMAECCDILLAVPSRNTPRIQEMHILLGHIFCQLVEEDLCG